MREIKFRGKRVDNNKWEYGYFVVDPEDGHRIYLKPFDGAKSNTYYFVIPETVGQMLTTIKRDNGDLDDIFEGDLIVHGERVLKVDFIRGNATLVNKENTSGILLSFNDGKVKVGNIHDNPELITN